MTRAEISKNKVYRYTGEFPQYMQATWKLDEDDGSDQPFFRSTGERIGVYLHLEELEPLEKTLDDISTLEVGDRLIDEAGEESAILGICGKVVFLSAKSDFDRFSDGYTMPELKNIGFRLATPTPSTPELLEIDGRRYVKAEVIERLKDLPEAGEGDA